MFAVAMLGNPSPVGAADWAAGAPIVTANEAHPLDMRPLCPGGYQWLDILGVGRRETCVTEGPQLRFGSYRDDNGVYKAAAAFRFDQQLRPLKGICDLAQDCWYAAVSDTLITRTYINLSLRGTVFRRDFSRHLAPQSAGREYRFDGGGDRYVLSDDAGKALPTGGMAVSPAGDWLAVELIGLGIARVDTATFDARRILAPGLLYGYGHDPAMELAITDDGKSVAVMGEAAGFSIIKVADGCGDTLAAPVPDRFRPDAAACAQPLFDVSHLITWFYMGTKPQFLRGGDQLQFGLRSTFEPSRRVILQVSGSPAPERLPFLALGDSFASGDGETEGARYRPGTNTPPETCRISDRSYPFLVAAWLDIPSMNRVSVACSGATLADVSGGNDNSGQDGRLGPKGLQLTEAQRREYQQAALENFIPGRIYQQRFVEEYQPELLTIGIGGNDAGLMDKLAVCAMPGTCEWAADAAGRARTAREIQRLFEPLKATYEELQRVSPDSRLYAVGYPAIINPDSHCGPVTALLFNAAERLFIDQGIRYLNDIIEVAAEAAGVEFVDIEQSLAGGRLCETAGPPTVNTIRFGDDIALFPSIPLSAIIGSETFHPTPRGHQLIAEAIRTAYPNMSEAASYRPESGCQTCDPPQPPAYWDLATADERRQAAVLMSDTRIASDQTSLSLALPSGSLAPGTTARIEVHSEPITLGEPVVTDDGSLTATVAIPPELAEGYHALHVFGLSMANEPLDLYQAVVYESGKPLPTNTLSPDVPDIPDAEQSSGGKGGGQDSADSRPAGKQPDVQNTTIAKASPEREVSVSPGPGNDAGVAGISVEARSNRATTNRWIVAGLLLVIIAAAAIAAFKLRRRRE